MTMMQDNERKMCKTDEYKDTTFVGAVYFVSHGEGKDVSIDWSFSHDFEDVATVPAPAALKALRDVWYQLNNSDASLPTIELDFNELKDLPPEEAHRRILEAYANVGDGSDDVFPFDTEDNGVRH